MRTATVLVAGATLCLVTSARADEGGMSFWLPGQQSNFAAAPGEPGSLTLGFALGDMRVGVDATLTGPRGNSISGSHADSATGFADLYPTGTVKWNSGVHNSMAYVHDHEQ